MPSDPAIRSALIAPGGLANRLRELRLHASLTGADLARKTGMSGSKVSRIETGHLWPTEALISLWCQACDADDQAQELVRMLVEARSVRADWTTRLASGHLQVSRAITRHLRAARRIVWWEIDVIPGMLQTAEYAHPIIVNALTRHGAPTDDAWESAVERNNQVDVVNDLGRQATIIIAGPALTWRYTPRDFHRAQLIKVSMVAGLPNVDVRIVPCGIFLSDVLPNPFLMVDDQVIVEDVAGEHVIVDAVGQYREAVDRLLGISVTGTEAADIIRQAVSILES